MAKRYDSAFVLTVKDVSMITGTSEQTARENLKLWKRKLNLEEDSYFTVYHLSIVLKVPLNELIDSIIKLYR